MHSIQLSLVRIDEKSNITGDKYEKIKRKIIANIIY